VDQESLVELAEFSLDEARTDDVNDPHLNVGEWDMQGFGDGLVRESASWGSGGKRSEREKADFAEEGGMRKALM